MAVNFCFGKLYYFPYFHPFCSFASLEFCPSSLPLRSSRSLPALPEFYSGSNLPGSSTPLLLPVVPGGVELRSR